MSSLSSRPSSPALTKFFGRTRELAAVDEALRESPVVSIVGPPGIGKTRIASEWIRRHEAQAGQAAIFVDLSVARGADDVLHAISGVVGCAPEHLVEAIAERGGAVLVLDNAEGAREAVATVVTEMAAKASDVRAVVTSRIRVGIDGERVIALEGLAPDDDALALFLDRARTIAPALDARDEAIPSLLRALDGVPLAIELAAARALLLSPSEIAARVRSSTLDTLVRTVGGPDSMRARYEWSVALLSPAERAALVALSAIPSEFSAADAEAVTGSLAVVEALREHHLVRATDQGALALYAGVRELIAETADRDDLSAALERWASQLTKRATAALADESDAAIDELRRLDRQARPVLDVLLARDCADAGDGERASILFAALARSRRLRGPIREITALGEKLVTLDALDGKARARVLAWLGVCTAEANSARARKLLEDAVAFAREIDDHAIASFAAAHLTVVLTRTGDIAEARRLVDSLRDDSAIAADDAAFHARVKHAASGVAMREGDLERAYREIESAIVHCRRVPSSTGVARGQLVAGMICVERGRFDLATTHLLASIATSEPIDDRATACMARNFLAEIRLYEGQANDALSLYQATAIDATRMGLGVMGAYAVVCRGFAHLAAGHLALADADFAEGRELLDSFAEQTDTALAEAGRACVAKLRGDDRLAAFVSAAGEVTSAGVAALLSFADGVVRNGPFANPGPRVGIFVAERLRNGAVSERPAPVLTILTTGFVVEGQPEVSLVGRPRLLALTLALAEAHAANADAFVTRARLVETTWPGERMIETAGANRLRVALSTLRKLGLPLDSNAAGIRLASGTAVRAVGLMGA